MANLNCNKSLRLFVVSESPNASNGLFELKEFGDPGLDQEFREDEIDERLNEVLWHLYGGGTYTEVTGDIDCDGKLVFSIDDRRFNIADLTGKIDTNDEEATYYILIDSQGLEYTWVVAESQGFVYSDSE